MSDTMANIQAWETTCKGSCDCANSYGVCHCNLSPIQIQTPRMESALRYYLKRYTAEIIQYAQAGDRIDSGMVDCYSFLLTEADRLERGGER